MKILYFFLLVGATHLKFSSSEYFSSTSELKNLKENHSKLVELLREFSKELEKKSFQVKNKLKEVEGEHATMMNDVEAYMFNPLNSFGLIKRLVHDIEALQEGFGFIKQFSKKADKIKLDPSELKGAVEGIYRLQETYELKSEHLAKGIIQNKRYKKELSPSDVLLLGKEMMHLNQDYAMDYIKAAKEINKKMGKTSKMAFLEELFEFYNSTSRYNEALEVLDEIFVIDSDNSKYEDQRMNIELLALFNTNENDAKEESVYEKVQLHGKKYTKNKESLIFSKACRGTLKKSIQEMSQLHCRYVSKTHFTKIAPFKVIEANLDPYIGIYLDVIADEEIEVLKTIAENDLWRAAVMTNHTNSKVSQVRVAQLNWQDDNRHKIYEKLTIRVSHMTGLNMRYAEKWQVQNYGIGGFYGPHHDFAGPNQKFADGNGNRIATVLFYLSDVEKGGGTVFPLLRIHVPPIKGAAVFWYNLSTSGDKEQLTRHAACPVIVGSKWVANKWIREYGQEFVRPCELTPRPSDDKYYERYYNLRDYGIYI